MRGARDLIIWIISNVYVEGKKACGLNQCKVGAISIFKLTVQLIFFEGLVDVVGKP